MQECETIINNSMDIEMVSSEVRDVLAVTFEDQQLLAALSEDEECLSEEQKLLATSGADEEQGLLATSRADVEQGLVKEEDDTSGLEAKHTIFLSHSGAQKDFVEQLCEDLERAKLSPFFDKRPESLPKGEVFARYIFRAAQQCELAIVVLSEEYFSRGKWPMLELSALVKSKKCKILPLFYKLSSKEFSDTERRERWYRKWDEWAQADPRIRIEDWKSAVRELDGRNGLEYPEALGEVYYRRDIVATAHAIMKKVSVRKTVCLLHPHSKSTKCFLDFDN